ncbi:MAG TPA: hypothetical protein VNB03_12045 [Casimicrobiaceae bacterium]|nr:hypothetical protein [Casimicrobiaceae bacterium]
MVALVTLHRALRAVVLASGCFAGALGAHGSAALSTRQARARARGAWSPWVAHADIANRSREFAGAFFRNPMGAQ